MTAGVTDLKEAEYVWGVVSRAGSVLQTEVNVETATWVNGPAWEGGGAPKATIARHPRGGHGIARRSPCDYKLPQAAGEEDERKRAAQNHGAVIVIPSVSSCRRPSGVSPRMRVGSKPAASERSEA